MLTILPVQLVIPPDDPPGITYYLPDDESLPAMEFTQQDSVETFVAHWATMNGLPLSPTHKILLTALPNGQPLAICILRPLGPMRRCFALAEVEYHQDKFSESILTSVRQAEALLQDAL
jgi:hypothetical protein